MQKGNAEITTLGNLLEINARTFKNRVAIICQRRRISYRELNREANRYANNLKSRLNIRSNDRVGILLNNSLEYAVLLFALFKLGATALPLNIFLTYEEIKFIVKDSGMKILFAGAGFLPIADKLKSNFLEFESLENIVLVDNQQEDFINLASMLRRKDYRTPTAETSPGNAALILYTSGTTGRPKGVVLTHRNILSNLECCKRALQVNYRDRFLLLLPMFHSFTLTVCIFFPLYSGARIIILGSVKPFRRVLRALLLNRVTILVGIPHLYRIVKQVKIPYFKD